MVDDLEGEWSEPNYGDSNLGSVKGSINNRAPLSQKSHKLSAVSVRLEIEL